MYGEKEFVLCVGAVHQRKNQFLLAQICNHLKLPVVLLGPVLPGEAEYGRRVGEAMQENQQFGGRWLQHLQNQDELLQSAYAACRVFALLSHTETQPISVLQAMAARKPVLLLRAPYTDDKLFRNIPKALSQDSQVIEDLLKTAWRSRQATELSTDFGWQGIARRLQSVYKRTLAKVQAQYDAETERHDSK
jgi:glycosyltransferase involved in cell wall biosynthesis